MKIIKDIRGGFKMFSYFCRMHKFIEYISDLLFLHDCVIIPDFGGFICNYRSAYIDESSGVICPPGKDILFNRNLIHNDGLLVNWISCKEKITYAKASSQLELFCDDLKVKLNQKQRVSFGDIGVFSTDRRFNIIFDPIKTNLFAETFGMDAVSLQKSDVLSKSQNTTTPSVAPDVSAYIGNGISIHGFQRLFKYALAGLVVTGLFVMVEVFRDSDLNITRKITHLTSILPNFPTTSNSSDNAFDNVISPNYDYVDYDPINDLNW